MAIWKKVDGWVYEYFELDTPASEFDGFEPIINLWNSKRTGTNIPSWSDFDFYDFKGWHGKVCKNTYQFNPFDYKVELFGVDFVELVGRDMTNMMGSELVNLGEEVALEMEYYEWICKNVYISRTHGTLFYEGREHKRANFLDLPLSDNGKTVTHSVEFMLPVERHRNSER